MYLALYMYYHNGGIIKQIMTNPLGGQGYCSPRRIQESLENGLSTSASLRVTDNFSRPPESLESNSITCQPPDQ